MDDRINDYRAGLASLALTAVVLVGLYLFAITDFFGSPKLPVRAHFREVSGLGENSKVNLGGKMVGRVEAVTFIEIRYECDPATEDGADRATRTDACEPGLFCVSQPGARDGACAELLAFSGHDGDYTQPCEGETTCPESDVCVDDAFFERNPQVFWAGPEFVCATYTTKHSRVEVRMAIDEEKLPYVRTDSVATVASSGPLGDALVNISVGAGPAIPPDGLLRSGPGLFDELSHFRDRFAAMGARVRRSFGDLERSGRAPDLGDPETLERTIASLRVTTDDMVTGRDSMSAFFGHESRVRLPGRLEGLRESVDTFDRSLRKFEHETQPKLRKAAETAAKIEKQLDALDDPDAEGFARLAGDPRLGNEVAAALDGIPAKTNALEARLVDVRDAVRAVQDDLEKGDGIVHDLFMSPKLYYAIIKALGNTERNAVLKSTVRRTISDDERRRASGR